MQGGRSPVGHFAYEIGGLGIRSASRTAPAAYWASWADALPMYRRVSARVDRQSRSCLETPITGMSQRLGRGSRHSGQERVCGRSQLEGVERRREASTTQRRRTGEWQHGWQYHGSSSLEYHFRESVVFAQSLSRH